MSVTDSQCDFGKWLSTRRHSSWSRMNDLTIPQNWLNFYISKNKQWGFSQKQQLTFFNNAAISTTTSGRKGIAVHEIRLIFIGGIWVNWNKINKQNEK